MESNVILKTFYFTRNSLLLFRDGRGFTNKSGNLITIGSLVVVLVLVVALGYSYLTLSGQVTNRDSSISSLRSQVSSANGNITADAVQVAAFQAQLNANMSKIQGLQTQIAQDQSSLASLNNQISQDKAQIASLQAAIQASGQQVGALQAQMTQLQGQVASLNSQVASLKSQIASLSSQYQTAMLSGLFTYTANCPYMTNCFYEISGSYANFGASAAPSTTATFTFYSDVGQTGQVVCQTTVALGNVGGRTLATLPQTTCSSSYPTAASWAWTFKSA